VTLEISDNGSGIKSKYVHRVFDPFFTTKATGVGTGLGLSVSRKIVELHGGQLTVKNRSIGIGAVASIILPTRLDSGKVAVKPSIVSVPAESGKSAK
jgi:signal transduction histidine kinase